MSRWIRRTSLLGAAVATVALTAACGNTTTGSSQQSSGSPTTASATVPSTGAPLNVSDDQAKQLCDMLRPQLSDWRVQGPTLGKVAFNATVVQWAVQNGLFLPNERGVVDRVTTKSCSDVRDQTLSALEIPNMAAGLVAG
ncbi:hypothetical protein KHQ06_16410 [Nocardia tengchongensis]|uniref:Lipoprotein n=1 Tax=Nocardia tengchongensis TaxID=2055889 RepID=A0ABX8D0F5_9NOCA|nr:hypothetical protein [Nocardia tengchongensis]QVI24210.1 hypothetical protein KHQ06_16410 [Nocardia tengchongensis]